MSNKYADMLSHAFATQKNAFHVSAMLERGRYELENAKEFMEYPPRTGLADAKSYYRPSYPNAERLMKEVIWNATYSHVARSLMTETIALCSDMKNKNLILDEHAAVKVIQRLVDYRDFALEMNRRFKTWDKFIPTFAMSWDVERYIGRMCDNDYAVAQSRVSYHGMGLVIQNLSIDRSEAFWKKIKGECHKGKMQNYVLDAVGERLEKRLNHEVLRQQHLHNG